MMVSFIGGGNHDLSQVTDNFIIHNFYQYLLKVNNIH